MRTSQHLWLFLVLAILKPTFADADLDPKATLVWGPGLTPDQIVLPARYFFIHAVDTLGKKLTSSPNETFTFQLLGESDIGPCRVWPQVLNRRDGSFIVRYKVFHTCQNAKLIVQYRGKHVASSPYKIRGPIYAEDCNCPQPDINQWLNTMKCPPTYEQIAVDMAKFPAVNFNEVLPEAERRFEHTGSYSFCNYVVKNNLVYRRCYGQHVGFKMFMDAILLSIIRKVKLPDLEFLMNLGDWPLIEPNVEPLIPMFAWCGSHTKADIVLPTYDITEASLECMGRVTLDMLSVQANSDLPWEEKIEKAFWRGRDSRRERLHLIDIAREHPDLINASLTNFFFFRKEEKEYGPKAPHVSFFKFFDHKYQLNIDGTVAAYRFPYLLAGDSVVMKQESPYYEHFYSQLEPWKHFIPIRADLSDLVEKIEWAKANDDLARTIGGEGRKFAQDHLMPGDIFCYHVLLLKEWSTKMASEVSVRPQMELVSQPETKPAFGACSCHRNLHRKEEL